MFKLAKIPPFLFSFMGSAELLGFDCTNLPAAAEPPPFLSSAIPYQFTWTGEKMYALSTFVSFFNTVQLSIAWKCQRQFHFFNKRLVWQILGNKNSWAGENIHALIANVLSKLHRNPHLHYFWWSNLTTREKVAGFFRKYKILLWMFLLYLLEVQNVPWP